MGLFGGIGSLGDVVFEVTNDRVLTPDKIGHSYGGRWSTSDIVGQKPTSQFQGPAQRSMTLGIRLVMSSDLFPEEESDRLRGYAETGEVLTLIIGGVTKGDFYIESASEDLRHVDNVGNVHTIALTLNLKEYA